MINETWRLAPWADMLYACDHRWWKLRGPAPEEFAGERVQGHIGNREGLWPGTWHGGVKAGCNDILIHGPHIGGGGNSGFQAVNLAVRMGARRIVLLGFDMGHSGQAHWHADHGSGMSNPANAFLRRCALILDRQIGALQMLGIEAVNASRQTALVRWPRVSLERALEP